MFVTLSPPQEKAMIAVVGLIVGALLFLFPLWWSGTLFYPNLGTIVGMSAILYGGSGAGMGWAWRREARRGRRIAGAALVSAGVTGTMAVIVGLLIGWAIYRLLTVGRVLDLGESLAVAPIIPIIGGLFGLSIAGGTALIAAALRRLRRRA